MRVREHGWWHEGNKRRVLCYFQTLLELFLFSNHILGLVDGPDWMIRVAYRLFR